MIFRAPDITWLADGGSIGHPRPALYEAGGLLAGKASQPPHEVVTVVGESDPRVLVVIPGEPLAICRAGACTYSMSSNYNGFPRLAVVLVKDESS